MIKVVAMAPDEVKCAASQFGPGVQIVSRPPDQFGLDPPVTLTLQLCQKVSAATGSSPGQRMALSGLEKLRA